MVCGNHRVKVLAERGEDIGSASARIMESGRYHVNRDQVLATLRAHEQELRASGIVRLSLFGSVARGERGNDVDLMAEFDPTREFSLLDMVGLENKLADILGTAVDLAPAKSLKDTVRERATREAIAAF